MSVVTAVTAQNSLGVQGFWELPVEAVRAQYGSVVDDIGVQAVKTGMPASAELVETVAELIAGQLTGVRVESEDGMRRAAAALFAYGPPGEGPAGAGAGSGLWIMGGDSGAAERWSAAERRVGERTQKSRPPRGGTGSLSNQLGGRAYLRQRETLPALMHEVQALSRFGVPLTTARTRWMFGFQRRDVRR